MIEGAIPAALIWFIPQAIIISSSSDKESYCVEMLIPANPIDAVRLLPIYTQVNDAMSSTECTNKEEAAEKYGELSRYAFYDERTVNEKHFVSFLTGNIKGDTAYMWVRYS